MRFALKTSPQMTTWEALTETWLAADEHDVFESIWTFDHFEPILGNPRSGPCFEGWTMLAGMATMTSRIRVGCLVTGMPYRHPAVLANMAATVDIMSGGRLELGLGAGWNQEESDAYGIELPGLKERFDRFDEGCEVIISLLSQERSDFAGEHFRLQGAHCEPKPIQRPHPPIMIGGSGPTRTLRAVARYAQRWNAPISTPEQLTASIATLREHCERIDRDPAEITITVQVHHDPSRGVDDTLQRCEELGDQGCEIAIIALPPACQDAATVAELAAAISR